VESLAEARATVDQALWAGSREQKVRVVLLVLLDLALARGTLEVQASVRQIAERSGLSKDSVMKHYLPLLKARRLIRTVKRHQGKGSTTYALNLRTIDLLPLPIYPSGCETSGGELSAAHDAFRQGGGLNKTGLAVLQSLSESGTAAEIHHRTGIALPSVTRILRTMGRAGLVTKTVDTWSRVEPLEALMAALDRYAYEAGVWGAGTRQRAFHRDERAARDAARTRESTIPPSTLPPKQGWIAVYGRSYWPHGDLVASEEFPAEGRVGPVLLLMGSESRGDGRLWLRRWDDWIEVRSAKATA
jgi:DNA-binding IscR family transcriptional regulator